MKPFSFFLVIGLIFVVGCAEQVLESDPSISWEEAVSLIQGGT